MTKKYLVHLEQSNDEYFFVVGPASWAFIHSPRPDFGTTVSVTESIPEDVKLEFRFPEDVPQSFSATIGSYENDRVLALLEGFSHTYDRPKGKFSATYHGYVY